MPKNIGTAHFVRGNEISVKKKKKDFFFSWTDVILPEIF